MGVSEVGSRRSGCIVSLEGISGCGKSHLLALIRDEYPTSFEVVPELTDRVGAGLDIEIIELLKNSGNHFFSHGLPLTETFVLLALKMFDYEAYISHWVADGRTVVEDRSIDTVAIYQAIMLGGSHARETADLLNTATAVYETASSWRPGPDATIIVTGDPETFIGRAESRNGVPYSEREREVLRSAHALYELWAQQSGTRIVVLDERVLGPQGVIERAADEILSRCRG